MWKTIAKWLRHRIDVDVDVDVRGGLIQASVTVKLGEVTLLSETFSWAVPSPQASMRLAGKLARRERLEA